MTMKQLLVFCSVYWTGILAVFFVFGGDFNAEKSGTNINMCIISARKTICCG